VTQRLYDAVTVGESLPPLAIEITTRLVVSAAIASRDYQDVHHDKAAAQAAGSSDIFMNILTTNGLVGRYITDWSGALGQLKKVAIRLGVPNYPGDTLTLRGTVREKCAGEKTVAVEIVGENSLGQHVVGSVLVALPESSCAGSLDRV